MKITTTAHRLTHHSIALCSDNITVHHNCTIENQIIIDSVAYNAVYKTHNNKFTMLENGTDKEIFLINNMYASDLKNLADLSLKIDTVEKLEQVYYAICDNAPSNVLSYLEEGHTFNADDYYCGILDDLYLKNAKKSNKQVLGASNLSELMIIICKINNNKTLTKKERVKFLTEFLEENKNKININAQDSHGQTALWYAKDIEVIELLLSYGACANVLDIWGANVLHLCRNAEKINLLSKLIK